MATVDLLVGEQLLASRFARPDDRQAPGTVEVPEGLQEISVLLEPQRVVGARLSAGDTVGVYLSQKLPDGTRPDLRRPAPVLVTQVQGAPAPVDPAAEGGTETVAAGARAGDEPDGDPRAHRARTPRPSSSGWSTASLWLSLETEGDETGGTRVLDPGTIYVGVPR